MKHMEHLMRFQLIGKRCISQLMVLFLTTLMCACGSSVNITSPSGMSQPVSVEKTDLTLYYPVQVDGHMAQLMEDLTVQFNSETPDVRVHIEFTGNYNETLDKLITSMNDGTSPDLVILDTPQLLTMIASDMVEPLDDLILDEGGYNFINDLL